MIYVLCPDDDNPWGGIHKLYRHVDTLVQHGIPATVLHQRPAFRCTWFANQTPIAYATQTAIRLSDYLVIPEIYALLIPTLQPGVRKVIFNQNCYNSFRGWPPGLPEPQAPYLHPDVVAALVVSQDSAEYLQYVFPRLPVHRLRYSIDPDLFHEGTAKQAQIAYMPRKQVEDLAQVLNILKVRRALSGFTLLPIERKSESEVAVILRQARIFLSFGHPEGFGLPPAEAMACGCVVVGYHGGGGREYFRPELAFPIEVGDILGYARTVEAVLRACRQEPARLAVVTRKAAAFIREHYTPLNETNDILAAWHKILGQSDPKLKKLSPDSAK